jgi:hypothetical protein
MSDGIPQKERAVLRAAGAMPVIEGALAFIVISFVATVWESIPADRRHDAFVVVYASGAHFIFSFALAGPMFALSTRLRSAAAGAAMTLALMGYVFWSLILQHRGLANLLLDSPWSIPMPFADGVAASLTRGMGEHFAFYLGPVVFAYGVLLVALALVWLPSRLAPARPLSKNPRVAEQRH